MSHLSAHFYAWSSQSHKSSLKFGKSLLQLGRINHWEYIPAVLVQIEVTTAALKRQQQDQALKSKERPQTALSSVSGMWRRRQEMGVTRGMQKASAQQKNWYLRRRTARALCGFFGRGVVVAAPVHLMSLWFVWFILPKFHRLWVRLSQSSVPLTLRAA